jgi:hypothetical protein
LLAGLRPGEIGALRWRHYDAATEPLGRLQVALASALYGPGGGGPGSGGSAASWWGRQVPKRVAASEGAGPSRSPAASERTEVWGQIAFTF